MLSETLRKLRAEIHLLWPLLAVWAMFLIWRSIAVRGVGVYGADVHLRAGWFLIRDFWTYVSILTLPLSGGRAGKAFFDWVQSDNAMGMVFMVVLVVVFWRYRWMLLLTFALMLPVLNIPALHRGYLPGAGYALLASIVLASFLNWPNGRRLWTGVRARSLVAGVLAVLWLGIQVSAAWQRTAAWGSACDWARRILTTTANLVPGPADNTRFYFFNLPQTYGEAYVFVHGLRDSVQALYGNRTLHAYMVYATSNLSRIAEQNEASLAEIEDASRFPQVFLVYNGHLEEGQELLSRVRGEDFRKILVTRGDATSPRIFPEVAK
jgi:hypothetical protein